MLRAMIVAIASAPERLQQRDRVAARVALAAALLGAAIALLVLTPCGDWFGRRWERLDLALALVAALLAPALAVAAARDASRLLGACDPESRYAGQLRWVRRGAIGVVGLWVAALLFQWWVYVAISRLA